MLANCWEVQSCPSDRKQECPAFKIGRGDKCWLVTGTLCKNQQGTMLEKMDNCRKCDFYKESNVVKYYGIKGKFILASAMILLVVAFLGLFSLSQMKKINNNFGYLIEHRVGVVSNTKDALIHFEKEALDLRGYILTGQQRYFDNYKTDMNDYEADMKVVKSLLTTEKGKELYGIIIDKYNIFNKYAETVIDLKRNKSMNEVLSYIDQNPGVNTNVVKASQDLIALAEQLMKDEQLYSEKIVSSATKAIIIVLILIMLICLAITIFLAFSISKPILNLEKQTNLIASGDLTASHVLIGNKDEIGSLANAYNQMINSLKDIVNRVATKAEDVAAASEQLSATAQQTAASATETASTVSEVVQTVDQLSISRSGIVYCRNVQRNAKYCGGIRGADCRNGGDFRVKPDHG